MTLINSEAILIRDSLLLCCPSGMEVVKIGGPVYRIGVGGGAASSVQVWTLQLINDLA